MPVADPREATNGLAYQYDYVAERVRVAVSRIRNLGDRMTADVSIGGLTPDLPDLFFNSNVNLLAEGGKKSIIASCSKIVPDVVDWQDLVIDFTWRVVSAARRGQPVTRLVDVLDYQDDNYLYYPFLIERQPTVLFGTGGSLKSTTAGYLALSVAQGSEQHIPQNVMILDWEDDERQWRIKMEMLARGAGSDFPPNVYYRRCSQVLADEADEIQSFCLQYDIGFGIVDSALGAAGEPEKSEATGRYFNALRSLNITTLTIAHVTNEDKSDRPFGSVFWRNYSRSLWQAMANQEPGLSSIELSINHRKVNQGMLLPAMGFRVDFDVEDTRRYTEGDTIIFRSATFRELGPEVGRGRPQRQQVLDYLAANGRNTQAEIATGTEISSSSIRQVVRRLLLSRAIQFFEEDETYGLAARLDIPQP